jgi:uncharacterized membrane protein YfcA
MPSDVDGKRKYRARRRPDRRRRAHRKLRLAEYFLVNIPLGAIGVWLTLRFVAETQRGQGTFDWRGQVLAIAALAVLITSVIGAETAGFAAPRILAGLGTALLCAATFIAVKRHARAPMLPLDFFLRAHLYARRLSHDLHRRGLERAQLSL